MAQTKVEFVLFKIKKRMINRTSSITRFALSSSRLLNDVVQNHYICDKSKLWYSMIIFLHLFLFYSYILFRIQNRKKETKGKGVYGEICVFCVTFHINSSCMVLWLVCIVVFTFSWMFQMEVMLTNIIVTTRSLLRTGKYELSIIHSPQKLYILHVHA